MGWIGKWRNLGRIIILATIFLMGQSNISFALEQWEKDLNNFLEEGKFDEAFELLNREDLVNNLAAIDARGALLATDLLSSGRDKCQAVLNLEKVFPSWQFLIMDLNFLYGGDWAGIAALEGNSYALYIVGKRTLTSKNFISTRDKTINAKDAYVYFYNAALLGYERAEEKILEIKTNYPDIDFTKYQTKIEFKEIYCPVRDEAK